MRRRGGDTVEADLRPAGAHDPGTELRRAVVATGLGLALGALAALFARKDPAAAGRNAPADPASAQAPSRRRAWRGKSAT